MCILGALVKGYRNQNEQKLRKYTTYTIVPIRDNLSDRMLEGPNELLSIFQLYIFDCTDNHHHLN